MSHTIDVPSDAPGLVEMFVSLLSDPTLGMDRDSFLESFQEWRFPAQLVTKIAMWRRTVAPLEGVESRHSDGSKAYAIATGRNGARCRISVDCQTRPGPVIEVGPEIDGLEIRITADPSDPAVLDAAGNVELRYGERTLLLDRTSSLPDAMRLMGPRAQVAVAERHGEPVGVVASSIRPARWKSLNIDLEYSWLLRVKPAARGIGLGPALRSAHVAQMPYVDGVIGHIQTDNRAMDRQLPDRWPTSVRRAFFDCRALASERVPDQPTAAADLPAVAETLNRRRAEEALYRPVGGEELSARLTRAESYTPADVTHFGGATLGVWRARDIWRDADGAEPDRVLAHIADVGVELGAEEDLLALVRTRCAELADEGFTHLAWYGSDLTHGADVLLPHAEFVESHDVFSGGILPAISGVPIHVDPVYF